VAEVSQGRHDGTDATLDDLCLEWLKELRRLDRSPRTIEGYLGHYEHDIKPTMGQVKVAQVTTKMLTDLYQAHTERGASAHTVYQIHAAISSMMSQACRWGWRSDNPARWAQKPTRRQAPPVVPTPEEVLRLIEAARKSKRPEYARAFFVAATTGIRNGEICAMRISRNINLDDQVLSVTHAIIEVVGQPPIEKECPKNRKLRNLALDPITISMIEAQLQAAADRASKVGTELVEDHFLFSNSVDGSTPWRPSSISQYFGRLRDGAELPHLKFKHFRKFMDTYGQELGFSLAQVALRAGHDPAVASRHYTGKVSDTDRALAAALASLISGNTPE
jgi:integrase